MQKMKRECLRLSECRLRGMIYELGESQTTSKVTRIIEISEELVCVLWAGVLTL